MKGMKQIEIFGDEADFFCPLCGTKVVDMDKPETRACKHLRYASVSEAPGMPEYIDETLVDIELSTCNELENVAKIDKAIKGWTMRFDLGDDRGYITLYLIFEVPTEDV